MAPRTIAVEFAKAMVSDDFERMRALLFVGSGDPIGLGEFRYQDTRVIGPPDTEPPSGAGVGISDPAPDFYVPFEAKNGGSDLLGSVSVTLSPDKKCVTAYSAGPVVV